MKDKNFDNFNNIAKKFVGNNLAKDFVGKSKLLGNQNYANIGNTAGIGSTSSISDKNLGGNK